MIILSYIVIAILFFSAFYWNRTIADGIDYGAWYIPHVTKVYISLLITISVFYRGILNPYLRKVQLKDLFRINWFFVGCVGLFLDVIKAPGYLVGALISPFIKFK